MQCVMSWIVKVAIDGFDATHLIGSMSKALLSS